MDTIEAATFSIRKLADPLGAEITGIDVGAPMSDQTFARIENALHEHCVVVFRKQRLTAEGHTRFSRRFGDLLVHVLKQYNDPQVPEVLVLSNIVENGQPIGIQDGGQYWHTDLSYTAEPSRCSLPLRLPKTSRKTNRRRKGHWPTSRRASTARTSRC